MRNKNIFTWLEPRMLANVTGCRTMFPLAVYCKIGALKRNVMSNQFLLLFSANILNQTSELNESANHLAKKSEKKNTQEVVFKDCRYLVAFLISCDKHLILLLTCFGSIFTRSLTLLNLYFSSRYAAFFSPQRSSRI